VKNLSLEVGFDMTHLIIWNGQRYWEEKIRTKTYKEFLDLLPERVHALGAPDIIYLISLKD
jgi:hypothetical protein